MQQQPGLWRAVAVCLVAGLVASISVGLITGSDALARAIGATFGFTALCLTIIGTLRARPRKR